jgi:UrcA family protein
MRFPLLIASVLTLAAGLPAHAAPIEIVQVRVSSAGLDLSTEVGADQFLQRLTDAAASACGGGPKPSTFPHEAMQAFRTCRAKAVAGAVAQSQSALLRQQFAATGGGRVQRLAAN